MVDLTNPIYTDPNKAREHLEALHWSNGPVCPHCGNVDQARIKKMEGKSHRPGVYQCNECRKPFSVTVGTVFEDSKIALNKWVLATHLMASSKKGISAHQLHRMLGVTYKTAWFMAHRIREAMIPGDTGPMGGGGGMVEADETYIGRVSGSSRMAIHNMNKVVSLVDRVTGRATSVVFTGSINSGSIGKIPLENVSRDAHLMTDQAGHYRSMGTLFSAHSTVNHARGEYVRKGDATFHTNTIEGFFGIFKRGMRGIYQHCGSQHLQRYLREFDFRYTNRSALGVDDDARRDLALAGIAGKRLTYRRTCLAA